MARQKKTKKQVFTITGALLVLAGALSIFMVSLAYPELKFWQSVQYVANPNIRVVRIEPGMRKEEVALRFGRTLGWSTQEQEEFMTIHTKANNNNPEGYYLPSSYIVSQKAKPFEVSHVIRTKFEEEVIERYNKQKNNNINLDAAIKIASIIEREAGSDRDMYIISGVIWNRLFQGMKLEMDATLQYARGSGSDWWPQPRSADKYIDSPFNTYKYKTLPPTAISNPSVEAIFAALNPPQSSTLFYLHDDEGHIYTARTYKEHLANIQKAY
jgi:uncharacterized YceG family protein